MEGHAASIVPCRAAFLARSEEAATLVETVRSTMNVSDVRRCISRGFVAVRGYQRRYGHLRGLRLAADVCRSLYVYPEGTLVPLTVPGLASPIFVRARTTDPRVFHQWFGRNALDFGGLQDPRYIIDAGANIGISALYFVSRFPYAHVTALEIEASNFGVLKANTAACRRIDPLHKGLWWREGSLTVANPSAAPWAYRARESSCELAEDCVEAVTVAQLIDRLRVDTVDLLKIDIEGGEREVLTIGLDDWIDRVRVIAVELHEKYTSGCTRVVTEALHSRGFRDTRADEYRVFVRQ